MKFLFDLDGTVTKQETLPFIAAHFGIEDALSELTEETVKGNIPFLESFIHRVHILKDFSVSEIALFLQEVEVYSHVMSFIQAHREQCCIVTGNLFCWIELLARRFGCQCYSSQAIVKDDHIERISVILRKEDVVRQMKEAGDTVVFVGDGNNDVEAMRAADRSIATAMTHSPATGVLSVADYLVLNEVALCRQLNQLL